MITIDEIIDYLKNSIQETDITLYRGASVDLIDNAEEAWGVKFPDDIRRFYEFANGFESEEDQFKIIPLEEIIDSKIKYKQQKLCIAEYMIYCDAWELQIESDKNKYQIIGNNGYYKIALTASFSEFLQRFLKGGVFEKKGLYDWYNELLVTRTQSPEKIVATFKIESICRIAMRGLVAIGEILSGEISPHNIVFIEDGGDKRAINIASVEYVRSKTAASIGLLFDYNYEKWDEEFRKLTGETIEIYSFL